MQPTPIAKAVLDVCQCESDLVEARMNSHNRIYDDFQKRGWTYIKKHSLVSWGIADYINLHRLNLWKWKEGGKAVVRYRNENQDSVFEDCIAQYTRACIDLWQQEKGTTQQINIEVQRSFEGIEGTRTGKRYDIFISSEKHLRPVIIIECKSGQGYAGRNWEEGRWKGLMKKEIGEARDHIRSIRGRSGFEFKTRVSSDRPIGIKYYKFVLYSPRGLTINDPREKRELMKQTGIFILLAKGPSYDSFNDYLQAREELVESEFFMHKAEDLFSQIKKELRL